MNRVEAVPIMINGQAGYDIRVIDPDATVQDYLDAVNYFIETAKCYRFSNSEAESCFGCDLCCQERIPVTIIDVLNLSECQKGIEQTVNSLLHVYVEGRIVDITMGLDDSGRCRFLDRARGVCRNYSKRPLVCQTFICCPSTRNAKKLREEIINTGEDELVRAWFKMTDKKGNLIIHEGAFPSPDAGDYPKTPAAGATSYESVKLRDICSPVLWRKIAVIPKK